MVDQFSPLRDAAGMHSQGCSVAVLGPLSLNTPTGLARISGTKQRALLALLVTCSNQVLATDVLLDALWPDEPADTAGAALRVCLTRLRAVLVRSLGDAITLTHQTPGYRLTVEIGSVDAHRFEHHLEQAKYQLQRGSAVSALSQLELADQLWRGQPFEDVPDLPRVATESARLLELYRDSEEVYVEALLAVGRHVDATVRAQALVNAAPLRERRSQQLILSLYRSGRQAEALQTFRQLRDRLDNELGVEPSPLTSQLHLDVLRQDPGLTWTGRVEIGHSHTASGPPATQPAPESARPPVVERLPFVGRDAALDLLAALVTAGQAGSVAIVPGPAGSGKTRLLAELGASVSSAGTVVSGISDPEGILPYQPMAQVCRQLLAATSCQADLVAADLAALLPELGPAGRADDPDLARSRLFEAVAWLLDDAPITFVVATRSRPDGASPSAPALLADLAARYAARQVWLTPLTEPDIRNLVEAVLPNLNPGQASELPGRILHSSAGSPLVVREILVTVAADPSVLIRPARSFPVTAVLQAIVDGRLAQLTPGCRRHLQMASVIDGEITADLVSACTQTTSAVAEAELDAATEVGGLLAEILPGIYGFEHDLLRQAVRSTVPPARRSRCLWSLGEHLAATAEDRSQLRSAHYYLAALRESPELEPPRRTIVCRAGLLGAQAALRLLAFEEALDISQSALDATPPSQATPLRADLLMAAASASTYIATETEAHTYWAQAAACARAVGDSERLALAAIGEDVHGRVLLGGSERLHLLEEAAAVLGPEPTALRVRVSSALLMARASVAAHPPPAQLDQLVEQARALGDPRTLFSAQHATYHSMTTTTVVGLRLRTSLQMVATAANVNDPVLQVRAQLCRVTDMLSLANATAEEIAAELQRLRELVARSPHPRDPWHLGLVEATWAGLSGDLERSGHLSDQALAAANMNGWPDGLVAYAGQQFLLHYHRGSLGPAYPNMAKFAQGFADVPAWPLAAGLSAAAAGNLGAAQEALTTTVPRLQGSVVADGWLVAVGLAAELAHVLAAPDPVVAQLQDILTPYTGQHLVFGMSAAAFGPVDRLLGLLADLRGQAGAAGGYLGRAQDQSRRCGAIVWADRVNLNAQASRKPPFVTHEGHVP